MIFCISFFHRNQSYIIHTYIHYTSSEWLEKHCYSNTINNQQLTLNRIQINPIYQLSAVVETSRLIMALHSPGLKLKHDDCKQCTILTYTSNLQYAILTFDQITELYTMFCGVVINQHDLNILQTLMWPHTVLSLSHCLTVNSAISARFKEGTQSSNIVIYP